MLTRTKSTCVFSLIKVVNKIKYEGNHKELEVNNYLILWLNVLIYLKKQEKHYFFCFTTCKCLLL